MFCQCTNVGNEVVEVVNEPNGRTIADDLDIAPAPEALRATHDREWPGVSHPSDVAKLHQRDRRLGVGIEVECGDVTGVDEIVQFPVHLLGETRIRHGLLDAAVPVITPGIEEHHALVETRGLYPILPTLGGVHLNGTAEKNLWPRVVVAIDLVWGLDFNHAAILSSGLAGENCLWTCLLHAQVDTTWRHRVDHTGIAGNVMNDLYAAFVELAGLDLTITLLDRSVAGPRLLDQVLLHHLTDQHAEGFGFLEVHLYFPYFRLGYHRTKIL